MGKEMERAWYEVVMSGASLTSPETKVHKIASDIDGVR